MTQPEPQPRSVWPSGGIADFIVGVLLEALGIFLVALTIYIIGRWYAPVGGLASTIWAAIFLAVSVAVLVRYPFAMTTTGAIAMLKSTVILCGVAFLIAGATEFTSANLIK